MFSLIISVPATFRVDPMVNVSEGDMAIDLCVDVVSGSNPVMEVTLSLSLNRTSSAFATTGTGIITDNLY